VSGELDGQITSEAIGALDDDRPDPIAGDPLQHGLEARALGHRIGAAHCRIVELGLNLIAIRPGKPVIAARCRCSLSLSALTLAAELVRKYAIAGTLRLDFMVLISLLSVSPASREVNQICTLRGQS
jgi:hypothetical protein